MANVKPIGHGAARTETFLETGPGTAAGDYMRRFWQPIYHSADLAPGRAVPLRIMGENFTLYRGESGRLCLTDPRCPLLFVLIMKLLLTLYFSTFNSS